MSVMDMVRQRDACAEKKGRQNGKHTNAKTRNVCRRQREKAALERYARLTTLMHERVNTHTVTLRGRLLVSTDTRQRSSPNSLIFVIL